MLVDGQRVVSTAPRIEDLLGFSASKTLEQHFPDVPTLKYTIVSPPASEKAFILSRFPFSTSEQLESAIKILQLQLRVNHLLQSLSLPTPYERTNADRQKVIVETFPSQNGLAFLLSDPQALITISMFEEDGDDDCKVAVEGEIVELRDGLEKVLRETRNVGVGIWWILKRWNESKIQA
ncbi:hypothetical protein BT69DRAFT_440278 [Atractiella rhizophila]|nr:hypothetical protein BT69DRAFT_440278 [Atractiella rhizophila]